MAVLSRKTRVPILISRATIEAFPQGEEMMAILKKAGFRKVSFRRLTFGICTLYFAEK